MMKRLRRKAPSSHRSDSANSAKKANTANLANLASKRVTRRLRVGAAVVLPLTLLVLALTGASAPGAPGAQSSAQAASAPVVSSLTTQDMTNPLGIDASQPLLGWVINSAARGVSQSKYEIRVATSEGSVASGQHLLWDSRAVTSGQSFDVPYGGPALTSRTRYYWEVRVWDNTGDASAWSQPAWFETAFLNPGQFRGDWIGDPDPLSLTGANWIWFPEGSPASSAPTATRYFLREVDIPANETLARANFLVTADDQWQVYVNGQQAGGSSGQTSSWTQAQELDITKELHPGANTIAVAATNAGGPGSWIGKLGLRYADGTTSGLATDGAWKASQAAPQGWQVPGFDDSAWVPALSVDPYGSGPWGTSVGVGSELLLHKNFALTSQPITAARLYVSGLSYPYMYINGQSVSDDKLAGAFTSYNKTVDYSTYDVTKLLHSASADNEIAVSLGNGFYAGGADDYPASGEPWQPAQPKLKLELDVQYANGTSAQVTSDPTWQVATGPTSFNSPAAEEYDAYQEKPGWTQAGGGTGWVSAASLAAPAGTLQAQLIPPVQVTGTVKPVTVTQPIADTTVYDFGITTSGWTRITMQGTPGTSVAVAYSEKLNPDGTAQAEGNGQAGQVDSYTFNGSGQVTFEPKYGWKGYRYVEVTTNSCPTGAAAPCTGPLPKILSVTGVIAHTNLATSGNFTSSSKLLNDMHTAMANTILNNQYSYGSDTPVYEKGGWTNDNGDYSDSEMANFDAEAYYTHMMQNFDDSQDPAGNIGWLVPTQPGGDNVDPLWGGSFLLIEYNMFQNYDNLPVIRRDYSHMAAYVDDLASQIAPSGDIYQGTTFGDWVVPSNANPPSSEMLGSMFLYRETEDLALMAQAIGNTAGASKYGSLAADIRTAVNKEFYDSASHAYRDPLGLVSLAIGGPIGPITSTAYDQSANVFGLAFGLAPQGDQQAIAAGLSANVTAQGNHLATGANGSKYILPMLSDYGYGDLAYLVATNPTAPGWGQWFQQCGATTMWEAWEDSSCNSARSRDHAFMGTVDDWLYSGVAGIQSTSAGFRTVAIDPSPAAGLTYASGYETTPLGRVSSSWTHQGTSFALTAQVPVGSRASVCVPATSAQSVTESGHPVASASASGVTVVGMRGSCLQLQVGSGTYRFRSAIS
jgi:alpha-L-rhamnosidase